MVKKAHSAGLKAILCFGETMEQREAGQTNAVLQQQMDAVKGSITNWDSVVIAYEP